MPHQLVKLTPNLVVSDVARAVAFYRDRLGFAVETTVPDAEPYVGVGDRVQKGQVVCIIEAMKLMNEIESDVSGVVQKIYPENAQPVEFGEPLFSVKTD